MKSKTSRKRTSLKLDISQEMDFKLIGISSHENDYRLVWAMNSSLKYNFLRSDNLMVHLPKSGQDLEFSKFIYVDEERLLSYLLISNRCPDGFLFPEIKNIDFLMQVIGELDSNAVELLLSTLKKIEIISGAYLIDYKNIKDIGKIMPA